MKVEIWSDVVCPWCYIGKRHLEQALEQFAHRDAVEVIWRSYQLDPTAPRTGSQSATEHLAGKRGIPVAQAAAMTAHVTRLAAEAGLEYHLDRAPDTNTFDAHRLIHLAARHGLQDAMKERLLHAYFTEGAAVGDPETLVDLAAQAGIPAEEARIMLAGDAYAAEVRADARRARAFGITGVPFFAVNEKYGVSGAQPAAVLLEVLDQAWVAAHPLVPAGLTGANAGSCADDACAI